MALALNVFQTVTSVVSTSPVEVYTAPVGYTGVVLLAQVTNIGASPYDITFIHRRSSTDTELVKKLSNFGKWYCKSSLRKIGSWEWR